MRKFYKYSKVLLVIALIAVVLNGCSGGGGSTQPIQMEREVNDGRPPIVLKGTGYQLELPAVANDVQCEPVSDEQEAQLKQQGYEFIAKPLYVTRNGNPHVQLGRAATVSFAIPEGFPEDRYDELVGMLITDKGAEYKIPDYYALREGIVKFETSHFSIAGAGLCKDSLRERFIEQIAVNGWQRNMSNKDLEPTWREQLNKFANDYCLGENDLVGIAMREVFGDKDIVKIGMDIVNAHDMENASFEQRAEVASKTMVRVVESKLLAYFLSALKEEDAKDDDEKDESKRNKIIGVLEEHFNIDNVEQVSTLLGEKASVEKCYIFACEYIGNYALDKWKGFVEEMVPYISYVKHMATATEIWKKFWAATQMQQLYQQYEEKADEVHGLLNNDMWNVVSTGIAAPEFLHGMKDEQIKEMIEKRYLEKKEIEARKAEARKYIALIDTTVDLNSECFEQKHFDYIQRLTVVNNLMDRFRSELLDKDGWLVYYDDGYKQAVRSPHEVNRQLCYVINEYLKCYPNRDKFYEWLSKNGFNYGPLKDEYKRLDDLLWKKKKDPDVHIVIQESMGASSGSAKYMGHTICLATNGKPYKDWYRTIPETDSISALGWTTEFPAEDVDIKLSQYNAIGRPNQVLVYASESAFLNGGAPIETFVFEVDTTNSYTHVELSKEVAILTEYYFNPYTNYLIGYTLNGTDSEGKEVYLASTPYALNGALEDALKDVHLFINLYGKGNNISFKISGEYSDGDDATADLDLTLNGRADFDKSDEYADEKEVGTCTMKATVKAIDRFGTQITTRYNLTGKVLARGWKENVDYRILCCAEGPTEYESVTKEGKRTVAKTEGGVIITFSKYFEPEEEEDY